MSTMKIMGRESMRYGSQVRGPAGWRDMLSGRPVSTDDYGTADGIRRCDSRIGS